jgi:hypothetical protein
MRVTVLHDVTVVASEDCATAEEVEYVALLHTIALLPDCDERTRFIDDLYDAVRAHSASGR